MVRAFMRGYIGVSDDGVAAALPETERYPADGHAEIENELSGSRL